MIDWDDFDITPFTSAPERMKATIPFEGNTPQQVFDIMGDPERITDWFLLAKEVRVHPAEEGQDPTFNVVFTFFGHVYEEVLLWNPPHRYVYLAEGPDFPIKGYIGRIEIEETGPTSGIMRWSFHYDQIQGDEFQRIVPVFLPPVIEASLQRLAPLIGGTAAEFENQIDG